MIIINNNKLCHLHHGTEVLLCPLSRKARAIALMDSKKMWRSSSLFCVFPGGWYPASAITLYAVLAGRGADGLMGTGMQWFIYWGRQEWWQVRPL